MIVLVFVLISVLSVVVDKAEVQQLEGVFSTMAMDDSTVEDAFG